MFRSLTVKEAAERNQVSKLADAILNDQQLATASYNGVQLGEVTNLKIQEKTGHEALADTLRYIESGDARKAETLLERTLPARAGAVAILMAMIGMSLGVGVAGICDSQPQEPVAVSQEVCPKSGDRCTCERCECPDGCPGVCGCSVALASKP